MGTPAESDRPVERLPGDARSVPSDSDETVSLPVADVPAASPFGLPVEPGEVGRLGPYRLIRELGHGGMGAVYAALDTRLDRRLALKVMLPQFAADRKAKERFLREARSAARVKHDNVVTLYEADERDGTPYIAMEYLEGYPLDEYLKRKGTPAPAQILRIAAETAAGLDAAHRLGLVHRDIKPANLWLEAPHGRVKVLDFGLARAVDAEIELTGSGAVVGTPAYMSPEQARGQRVDHRTDLFSLGAVLYRLGTGRLPFEGPTAMAVLMALGTEEPRPARELNPALPEPLAALTHQLLAKRAEDRPQSADEVVRRLRAMARPSIHATTVPAGRPAEPAPPRAVSARMDVTAQPETNPFADLDTSEAEPAAPEPARAKPRGTGRWLLAGLAALLAAVAGVVVTIKNKDGTETRIEAPDGATVTVKDQKGKTLARVGPEVGPPAAADPERAAAAYVLSIGGRVRVDGEERELRAAAELPKGRFALTAVNLYHNAAVTDAGLAAFRDCKGLTYLYLGDTAVTDAGLAPFKDCKGLTVLRLGGTKVTDAGLASFRDCKELTELSLAGTKVTDAGLAAFRDCKGLTALDLRKTRVTATGLADFHAAVPGCKVEHDGGTLEPTAAADPDRAGAAYVLSIGGGVRADGEERELRAAAELPKGRFALTGVNLRGNTKVTDAGLAAFRDCKGLTFLGFGGTRVTDAGLATFKDRKGLTYLDLYRTQVTDAGLATFEDCKGLTYLNLNGTQVTDTGLAAFRDCKGLMSLNLNGTQVTDAGLAAFKDCKGLTLLDLLGTKVTDAGLAPFEDCKGLTHLDLDSTQVTDAGLAAFKDCKGLTYLSLGRTRVTDAGLAPFKDCKGLTRLYLGGTRVTDAGLAAFKDCKGLTHLDLSGTAVTDAGLAHFRDCNALTEVRLGGTQLTDAGLAAFKECKGLSGLHLDGTKVTDAGLAAFEDCKGLTQLNLGGTAVTDAGLAAFKDCKALTLLNVIKTRVTAKGLADFHAAVPGCKVEHDGGVIEPTTAADPERAAAAYVLSIGGGVRADGEERELRAAAELPKGRFALTGVNLYHNAAVTDAGLAAFRDCKGLTYLDLYRTQVTDAGLATFEDCKGLTYLDLTGTKVMDTGLTAFKDCKGLTVLCLGGTRVTDAGLAPFRDCKGLRHLYLLSTKVTDAGLAAFADCKGLTQLDLGGTRVTDAGLAPFRDCKGLTALYLGGTRVTDVGLAAFKDCKGLTVLNLGGTKVTDAGLAAFKDCKGLTQLNLSGTAVTDAGLAAFKECKGLTQLNLGGTAVTDAGLAAFKDCKGLTELLVRQTRVTAKGLADFHAAVPGCKVEHDGGVIEPKK